MPSTLEIEFQRHISEVLSSPSTINQFISNRAYVDKPDFDIANLLDPVVEGSVLDRQNDVEQAKSLCSQREHFFQQRVFHVSQLDLPASRTGLSNSDACCLQGVTEGLYCGLEMISGLEAGPVFRHGDIHPTPCSCRYCSRSCHDLAEEIPCSGRVHFSGSVVAIHDSGFGQRTSCDGYKILVKSNSKMVLCRVNLISN